MGDVFRQSAFLILRSIGDGKIICTLKRGAFHPIGGKVEEGEDPLSGLKREVFEEIECNTQLMRKYMDDKMSYLGINVAFIADVNWIQHFYLLDLNESEINALVINDGDDKVVALDATRISEAADKDEAFKGYFKLKFPGGKTSMKFVSIYRDSK